MMDDLRQCAVLMGNHVTAETKRTLNDRHTHTHCRFMTMAGALIHERVLS